MGFVVLNNNLNGKKNAAAHLRNTADQLDKSLKKFGIRVTAPYEPGSTTWSWFGSDKEFDGKVYENQIEAFTEILSTFVKWERNHFVFKPSRICVTSLTQVGKTSLLNLLSALGPCIHLLTGTNCLFIRFLINDYSLEDQTSSEAENFIKIYGELVFSYRGTQWTIKSFMESFRSAVQERDGVELPLDIKDFGACMRTSISQNTKFIQLREVAKEKGLKVIVAVDESHARADKKGVMDRMLATSEKHFLQDDLLSFIGVSASNFALAKGLLDLGYTHVSLRPGKNYTGYPYDPVTEIEVDVDAIPRVFSHANFDELVGTNLACYNADWATDQEKYNKHVSRGGESWSSYQRSFIEELGNGIEFLFDKNPANGRGILIRLCRKNGATEGVRKQLASLYPDIEFHSYNSDADEVGKLSLKKFISQKVHKNRQYVIFVTGRGRMGTAAPSDLRYGFDFSANAKPEPQILMQGIAGRLTGYNKGVPWVVMSQTNADMLNGFIETGAFRSKVGKGVSPYKKHIGLMPNFGKLHISFKPDQMPEECIRHLTKVVKTCAEVIPMIDGKGEPVLFSDGTQKKRVKRRRGGKGSGYVLNWKPLVKLLNDPKFLQPQVFTKTTDGVREGMDARDGNVQIAIRLWHGSYTYVTDKNRRKKKEGQTRWFDDETEADAEAETIDRRPIITIDDKLEIIEVWFPLANADTCSRLENQMLKRASAYHPNDQP